MNIYLLLIIIIFLFIILFIILFRIITKKMLYNNEKKRNIIMKGFKNMQYYIPFNIHYNLFIMLKTLLNKFNQYNIKYFVSCGALIGYHRHNKGFIPWDDDIDICLFEEDKELIRKCLIEICNENKDYKYKLNMIDKLYNNELFIDLFYLKYYEDKKYYHYDNIILKGGYKNEFIYKNEIFPLKQDDYYLYMPDSLVYDSIKINIPNKSINFLNRAYKNWDKIYKVHGPHNKYLSLLYTDANTIKCFIIQIIKFINVYIYRNIP
jgi:phosphorylcholine metabolism protein LicD